MKNIHFHLFSGKTSKDVWHPNMNVVVAASHLLITTKCSTNFVIYCLKVTKFTFESIFRMLCRIRVSATTSWRLYRLTTSVEDLSPEIAILTKQPQH